MKDGGSAKQKNIRGKHQVKERKLEGAKIKKERERRKAPIRRTGTGKRHAKEWEEIIPTKERELKAAREKSDYGKQTKERELTEERKKGNGWTKRAGNRTRGSYSPGELFFRCPGDL